jgi:endoglucanase
MSHQYVAGKNGLKSFSLLLSVTLATLAGQLAVAGGKRENAQQLPANIDLPQEILIPQELPMNNPAATLSVDPYGGLYTVGNQIVDQTGGYCRMTGVNFSGFETALGVPHGLWARDYGDMIDQIASMGFNTIRVPFSIDNMLSETGQPQGYVCGQYYPGSGNTNQAGDRANNDLVVSWNSDPSIPPVMKSPKLCLDAFIKRAGSKGLKIILDCHSQNNDDYTNEPLWYKSTQPQYSYDNEQRWLDTWEMLAARYSNPTYDPYAAVIACDLFNEPKQKPTGNATGCAWLAVSDYVSATTPGEAWNYAAQRCAETIYSVAPRMLIMVEGTQWANTSATRSFSGSDYTHWGANLKGAKTILVGTGTDYENKVIYSIHDYPESTSYLSYYNSDPKKTGHAENPLPWFPRSCNYNPPSGKSYPYNLSAQAWEPFWGFLVENNTAPIHVGELGSWLSGNYGYTPSTPGSTSYTGDLQYWINDSLALGCSLGGTATSVTPAQLITSDNQWLDALLHYMDGDYDLVTNIDGLKDSTAVDMVPNGGKGISFTWFTYNADSADTGGMVLDDFKTVNTEKLAFLTPYLAPMITTTTTTTSGSYGGGIQGERVVESPSTSLLVRGNPLSKCSLRGGKVEFALSRLPMAGTFAWKDSSIVPTEGTSTQFVRFTPANSAFRSVLIPIKVKTVVPTIEEVETRGDSTSTFGPFYGVNLCGAEYAPNIVPGTNGVNYAFPTEAQTSYYVGKGMNIVRLPFLWERLQPTLSGSFDSGYQTLLVNSVNALRATGATVLIDVHNYNRRKIEAGDTSSTAGIGALASGSTTSSVPVASFSDLWTRLANLFKDDQGVVFGLMNEPTGGYDSYGHQMTTAQWVINANAAITAIRATGAQNWLTCPGNFYTGAWSWTTDTDSDGSASSTNAVAMLNVKDSLNKTVIEVHQYFDANYYQGKSQDCVTSDGEDLLSSVTAWARTNGKKLFLGEFGSGNNSTCESAVAGSTQGVLQYMQSNSDVWAGWTWWSSVADNTANGQYAFNATDFSLAPVNGVDSPYMSWLTPYVSAAFTADLDRNGYVNTADLSNMLLNFGECTAPGCGDLNKDGQVDYSDVGLMLLEFHD